MTIGRGLAAGLLAAGLLVSPAMAAAPKPWGDVLVNPQGTGRWLRAESDHVIVYTDEGPEIARRTAEDVEALDRVLRTLYGKLDAPAPRKFPIYLVKAPKRNDIINPDYRRFIPDAMITAVSVDVAEPDDIFAVVVRDSFHFHRVVDQTLGDDGVLGAYALHFFSENFPFRQPRWLTKGAGVYYSSMDIRPGYVTIGDVPALFDNALAAKNLDAVPRLIAERDIMADPWAWGYDAQAALLVRYLWSDPDRKARLATYLDKLEAGATDPKAAWTEAFGEPPEALEAGLRAFLDAPAVRTTLPRTEDRPPTIRIRKMPRGADDLILEIQRLKASPSGYVAGLLDYVRKTAARRPGERYSRQAQARAEIVLGDRDKGEQLLTKLLDEDAGNLEALRLMGTSKLYRAAAEPDPRAQDRVDGLRPKLSAAGRRGRTERLPDPVPAGADHGQRRDAVAGEAGPATAGGPAGAAGGEDPPRSRGRLPASERRGNRLPVAQAAVRRPQWRRGGAAGQGAAGHDGEVHGKALATYGATRSDR